MQSVFVTGTAGFIGFHLARVLLDRGVRVTGYDALTDFGGRALKQARHAILLEHPLYTGHVARLEDMDRLTAAADAAQPDVIVHLAAQAGVRYSLENPRAYIDSNLVGSFNVMEAARTLGVGHFLMASTSSVYGAATEMPFVEGQQTDRPLTIYAATKKAGEAMTHSYAHLHEIPTTMFRFFTVYGPWGRPDMAPWLFTEAILAGRPINIYNHGRMSRDFTYVDDLVAAIVRLVDVPPPVLGNRPAPVPGDGHAPVPSDSPAPVPGDSHAPVPGDSHAPVPGDSHAPVPGDTLSPVAPWRVVNIGNSRAEQLEDFITAIEAATGRKAVRNYMDMQQGDVPATWADASLLKALTGHSPQTPMAEGVARFVAWYRDYHGT